MGVIVTDGALRAIRGAALNSPAYSPPVTDVLWQRGGHGATYRQQPSVRTSVDALAKCIASFGLQLFERLADNSRVRDRESEPARLMVRPWKGGTTFDFIVQVALSYSTYGEALIWKAGPAGARTGLLPIPLRALEPGVMGVGTASAVAGYAWTMPDGGRRFLKAENFIRIYWPDPDDFSRACSPLETLRGSVAEDQAAASHQRTLLANGARWAGVIERPKSAGVWTDPARERIRQQLEESFSGPAGSGRIPILEDDMTFKETSWSPTDLGLHERRLAIAEDITRLFQVPLPVAGILTHATFSNVREQHKNFYQDTIAPITTQIEESLRVQLLDEYEMGDTHYFEFNINEKLKGSFEEASASYARAVGGPWMTPNEARARENLPALEGGDRLYPQPGSGMPAPVVGEQPEGEPAGTAVH